MKHIRQIVIRRVVCTLLNNENVSVATLIGNDCLALFAVSQDCGGLPYFRTLGLAVVLCTAGSITKINSDLELRMIILRDIRFNYRLGR